MTETEPEFRWYILQAYAGFERRVEKMLREQLRIQNMEHLVLDVFIPSEEVTIKRKGKERTRIVTYFPGYMLLHICLTPDLWHLLRGVPKVSGFVGGTPQKPEALSEKELNSIKEQIKSGKKQAELDSVYQIGQNVKIVEGPFADFDATIESVDSERSKLSVMVNIFGRATPLELNFDKIKISEE